MVLSNNKFEILFSCRSFRSSFFLYGNVSSNAANARSAGNPLSSIATSTTASSDKQRANKILVAGFAPPLFFKFATTRVLIRVLSKPGVMARRIRVNVRENIEQKVARSKPLVSCSSAMWRSSWRLVDCTSGANCCKKVER